MEVVVPNYYQNIEETYGIPLYSVHRVDLHNELKLLATQDDGPGFPVDIQVRSEVVGYDAVDGKVVLADDRVLQADLIVAASGVHSTAVQHVLGNNEIRATDTGWATMRWLVPTEELVSDPDTSALVEDSDQRYFTGAQGTGGLVWYPCRKWEFNNQVQNFLYLSRSFDSAHATEDFKPTVEPNVVLEYAKKDFSLALQSVVRKAKDVRFWKLVAKEPIPTWHKDRLVVIGDAAHPMLPFQAQGGNQAIEDGAALGVLLYQVHDDREAIEERLRLFEQVRRNRGSSLQVLSNSGHPQPKSVFDAAAKYLRVGRKLENSEDVNEYLFSIDVIKESKAIHA